MNTYYQTAGSIPQNPSNEKQSTYPNMTYAPQGGLPPGNLAAGATSYGTVPAVSVGYNNPSPVFPPGATVYPNGYRAVTPTSYVSAQQYQPPTTVSAYRTVSPQYAATRFPVAPIPSPGYPSGIPSSPTYPGASYLTAHNTLNSSLAYPGTTLLGSSSTAGYAVPSGASFYAGPPAYPTSAYPAAGVPAATAYPSGGAPTIATPVYPGASPYAMPRP